MEAICAPRLLICPAQARMPSRRLNCSTLPASVCTGPQISETRIGMETGVGAP
eukprot:COSAG06_NODE_27777_length_586_cov_8.887064_1_plen_52_part_10